MGWTLPIVLGLFALVPGMQVAAAEAPAPLTEADVDLFLKLLPAELEDQGALRAWRRQLDATVDEAIRKKQALVAEIESPEFDPLRWVEARAGKVPIPPGWRYHLTCSREASRAQQFPFVVLTSGLAIDVSVADSSNKFSVAGAVGPKTQHAMRAAGEWLKGRGYPVSYRGFPADIGFGRESGVGGFIFPLAQCADMPSGPYILATDNAPEQRREQREQDTNHLERALAAAGVDEQRYRAIHVRLNETRRFQQRFPEGAVRLDPGEREAFGIDEKSVARDLAVYRRRMGEIEVALDAWAAAQRR